MTVAFSSPDNTPTSRFNERISERPAATYPAHSFPLDDLPLYESQFLVGIRKSLGGMTYTPATLTNVLRGVDPLEVASYLFHLADILVEEFKLPLATRSDTEMEGVYLNVLTLLHVYLNESIVPDTKVADLDRQINFLIDLVARKDETLYRHIKNLFSVYTRVGKITTEIDLFKIVTLGELNLSTVSTQEAAQVVVDDTTDES